MAELLKFSLVQRLAETQTFSIHRLVQAVQMDTMEPKVQRQWAERAVRGVEKAFLQTLRIWHHGQNAIAI